MGDFVLYDERLIGAQATLYLRSKILQLFQVCRGRPGDRAGFEMAA